MIEKSTEEVVKSVIKTVMNKLPKEDAAPLFKELSDSTHRKLVDGEWVEYWEVIIEGVAVKYYPETGEIV